MAWVYSMDKDMRNGTGTGTGTGTTGLATDGWARRGGWVWACVGFTTQERDMV